MHRALWSVVLSCIAGTLAAQPSMGGFRFERIAERVDGLSEDTKIEAIDGGPFGTGAIIAHVGNGFFILRTVGTFGYDAIASATGLDPDARLESVTQCIGVPGFDDGVYATTSVYSPTGRITTLWRTRVRGELDPIATFGPGLALQCVAVDSGGFAPGLYAWDSDEIGGRDIVRINPDLSLDELLDDGRPPARPDFDVVRLVYDFSGQYGGGLLFLDADRDLDSDGLSSIHSLSNSLQWSQVLFPSSRDLIDMELGGLRFFDIIYAADANDDSRLIRVLADGLISPFAEGFNRPIALSVSSNGRSMYVIDAEGVWFVRAIFDDYGPSVSSVAPGGAEGTVITGAPIDTLRIRFSEPILASNADITITNARGQPVPFNAIGSRTNFLIIGLGEPLSGDEYTVTLADTITSIPLRLPLDGDNDGIAGGDAVLTFTHACPADQNFDGLVNPADFNAWILNFNAGC